MEKRTSALTELLRKPCAPPEWGQPLSLWIHDDHVSNLALIVHPEVLPDAKEGDCVALCSANGEERVHVLISSLDKSIFRQRAFQVSFSYNCNNFFTVVSFW